MAEITIKSALPDRPDGGEPVAFSEHDAEHPGDGWIFVAGKREVRAAETPGVLGALRDGRVEKVEAEKAEAQRPAPAPAVAHTEAAPTRPAR